MSGGAFGKLHPAVSFGFFILAACLSALVQHPIYLMADVLCALSLNITISGWKAAVNFAKLLPFWAFLSAINPLFNTLGERVLFTLLGRPYTLEALCYGMVIAGMLVAMLQWFSAYNAVMTEDKFTFLFGSLAPSLSLLLTTVLRRIPNFLRKAKQIADARKCIGMGGGENAGLKEKVTDGMVTLSILVSWALEGSVTTADSMNSRGYGAAKRSCYHSYRVRKQDGITGILLAAFAAVAIGFLAGGSGRAAFTPVLVIAPVGGENLWGFLAYLLFLLMPTILNVTEEVRWFISRSKI